MRSRPLLSLVLAVAALAPWRARAAVELNVVSAVQVKDAGSAVVVTIQGSRPPNFTTFSMADPPRFVIDLSESRFQGVPEDVVVQDGIVNVVKNLSYGSDATAISRVMIAFQVEVEPPDVRAEGNALVVRVAKPGAPAVAQADAGQKLGSDPQASATPDAAAADRAAAEARAREAEARAEAEAKTKAEAQARADAEAKAKADTQAQAQAEADARAKAEAEASAAAQAKAAAPKPPPDPAAEARARARAEMRARVAHLPPPVPDDPADATPADAAAAQATSGAKLDDGAPSEARAGTEQKIRDDEPAAPPAASPDARAQAITEATAAQQLAAQAEADRAAQEKREAEARAEAARQSQEAFDRQKAEADAQTKAQVEAAARAAEPAPAPAVPSRADRLAAEAPRARLKEIGFKQLPGISRVFVRTTVTPRFTVQDVGEDTIRVELENTRVVRRNDTRFLDTSFFPSAVVLVTPRSRGSSLVVDIKLKQRVPFQQKVEGDMLALDFERPGTTTAAAPARAGDVSPAVAGEGTKLDVGDAPSAAAGDAAPQAAGAPAR